MKRAVLYVVLGILAVAAVAGVFVWRSRPAAQSEDGARSVVVERDTVLVAVAASGSIEPQARVALAFEVSGRVAEVPVEVGDRVASGDVLVELDTRQLALQMQQAQASLALAESQLAQLQAGPRPEEIAASEANVQAAQSQVSAAAASRGQAEAGHQGQQQRNRHPLRKTTQDHQDHKPDHAQAELLPKIDNESDVVAHGVSMLLIWRSGGTLARSR